MIVALTAFFLKPNSVIIHEKAITWASMEPNQRLVSNGCHKTSIELSNRKRMERLQSIITKYHFHYTTIARCSARYVLLTGCTQSAAAHTFNITESVVSRGMHELRTGEVRIGTIPE